MIPLRAALHSALIAGAVSIAIFCVPDAAAVTLRIHVVTNDDTIRNSVLSPAVIKDAQGAAVLNFNPKDPEHQFALDTLAQGIPIKERKIQMQLAKLLDSFPSQCQDHIVVNIVVAHVGDLGTYVPGVTDANNSRIHVVTVKQCLAEPPDECIFNAAKIGNADFRIGDLTDIFTVCSAALDRDIKNGAKFADWSKDKGP